MAAIMIDDIRVKLSKGDYENKKQTTNLLDETTSIKEDNGVLKENDIITDLRVVRSKGHPPSKHKQSKCDEIVSKRREKIKRTKANDKKAKAKNSEKAKIMYDGGILDASPNLAPNASTFLILM
ncbi:hypothetical protein TorRG33x02_293590 [Trema orientale]|uniref:Uncharacterized protein n=1 Tax=Trema orientale TaxID=63057 RepID=A0A2P5C948_TREOI|nr:hypothetical protein TorRG33x02_293590 [Trema orientale]